MKFTPVTQSTQQEAAFAALYAAFRPEPAALGMPLSGSLRQARSGLIWKWTIEPKSLGSTVRLWKNEFRRQSVPPIMFTVPLHVVDVNDGGLIARREDGRIFLCRQTRMTVNKVPRRSEAVFDVAWSGPTYDAFEVKGDPGTRTYFACIPLSRGPEAIREELNALIDGIRDKPATPGEDEAKKLMWEHYEQNRERYPSTVGKCRSRIIALLMQGLPPAEAFDLAFRESASVK